MKLREYLTKSKIGDIINTLDNKIEKNVFNITQALIIDRLYHSLLLDEEIIHLDNIDGKIKSYLVELIKEVKLIVQKKKKICQFMKSLVVAEINFVIKNIIIWIQKKLMKYLIQ